MKYALILCSIMFVSFMPQDDYFQKVLSDFGRHSYFISINICAANYKGKIAIENSDLYAILSAKKKISESDYKKQILEKLKRNECILLDSINFDDGVFFKVSKVDNVNELAKKGIDSLIDAYFDHDVLKKEINDNVRSAIINKLFEQNVLCAVDDETGYLVIYK